MDLNARRAKSACRPVPGRVGPNEWDVLGDRASTQRFFTCARHASIELSAVSRH